MNPVKCEACGRTMPQFVADDPALHSCAANPTPDPTLYRFDAGVKSEVIEAEELICIGCKTIIGIYRTDDDDSREVVDDHMEYHHD